MKWPGIQPVKPPPYLDNSPCTIEDYFKIATELSKLQRRHRVEIGKKVLEKAQRADVNARGFSFFSYYSGDIVFPVVFVSSRQDRAKRRKTLYNICAAAYVKFNVNKIIGIATQNFSAKTGSQDYLLLEDVKFDNTDEIKKFADTIFQDLGSVDEDEWGNKYN